MHGARLARGLVALAAIPTLVLGTSAVASAGAAPGNDTFGGAVTIDNASLPYSQTLDTTSATTDADDTAANSSCGAPATNGSVWYTFTAPDSDLYALDLRASDYSAGAIVVTGAPGHFSLVSCGPGAIMFPTTAGTTYSLLLFSDNPSVVGGNLTFTLEKAPPAPVPTITVDKTGTFDSKTGQATVSGTLSCDSPSVMSGTMIQLSQAVGRVSTVSGAGDAGVTCAPGTPVHWSATILPYNGRFAGGKATADVQVFACNEFQCGFTASYSTLSLRKR